MMNEGLVDVDLEKLIGNLYVQLQGQAYYIQELQSEISILKSELDSRLSGPAARIAREGKEVIDGQS